MLKNIKEIIILIFVILALCASAWSFLLKKVTVDERLLAEDSLFNETIIKKKAEEKLSRIEKEKEGLQNNVDKVARKAEVVEKELAGYKDEIDSFKSQLSGIDNDNVVTKGKIREDNTNIDSLKNRIGYITKDTLNVSRKLTLLAKTRDALKERLSEYTRERSIRPVKPEASDNIPEPIIQKPAASLAQAPAASSGEVLTINREFAFLVISLGKRDGITEGMLFNIQRNNKNLGQIKVETVRENISAAALINKDMLLDIRAGDVVLPVHKT